MSQITNTRTNRPRPRLVNPAELSNLPARRGKAQAVEFFKEIGVQGITETAIRNATERGGLRRFKIAGMNWYSDADLWEWLQGMATGGRVGGDAA
ncbi:hypothetical protein [Prescottella equi]|uniref:hypothetical protein n=1 Tax=Rhodococcus hoagii TaxID=43767 RepID=UPI00111C8FC7|nr:hypothetical protein [Prescottella equi]